MFKKTLSLFLIGSLLLSLFAAPPALAKTKEEKAAALAAKKAAALAAKVKAGVAKLGASKDTKISVKLRNSTKKPSQNEK